MDSIIFFLVFFMSKKTFIFCDHQFADLNLSDNIFIFTMKMIFVFLKRFLFTLYCIPFFTFLGFVYLLFLVLRYIMKFLKL